MAGGRGKPGQPPSKIQAEKMHFTPILANFRVYLPRQFSLLWFWVGSAFILTQAGSDEGGKAGRVPGAMRSELRLALQPNHVVDPSERSSELPWK